MSKKTSGGEAFDHDGDGKVGGSLPKAPYMPDNDYDAPVKPAAKPVVDLDMLSAQLAEIHRLLCRL